MIAQQEYYSNCLLEAIKARLKYGNSIKIICIKSKDGLCHFLWHDKTDNNVYDFEQIDTPKHWINLLWYKGRIENRPYEVYERCFKNISIGRRAE